MKTPRLWTVSQISEQAKVSRPTVTDALRKGHLRGTLMGRTWVVSDDDARAYIGKRKALAKAADAVGRTS